jgi:hypothetical protein
MMFSRAGLVTAAVLVFAGAAFAQEPDPNTPGPWKFTSSVGLNLSQSTFTSNWAGGDLGSLVWVLSTQSSAERQFSTSFNWTNKLNLSFGQTSQQQRDPATNELRWDSPDKSSDLIFLESLGRWTLGGFADPYAALSVESQFHDQTDPRGSINFNPIKVKGSAGLAKLLYKTENSEALTRVGVAARQIFGKSFTDPLGLNQTSYTSNDVGVEWQTDVTQPMFEKKVVYKGSLLFYQPVTYSNADALETVDATLRAADPTRESIADFWQAIDINLRNDFAGQITKSIGVNLALQFVYDKFDAAALVDPALAASPDPAVRASYAAQIDKNVRKAGQFREVFSLAITYQLF